MTQNQQTAAQTDAEWRQCLITDNLHLIGQQVSLVSARFPRHVERQELWNAGALGLVEASRRYRPELGPVFARYAVVRIRGAIIDATRARDWVPRSVRRKAREMDEAAAEVAQQRGTVPPDAEVARVLGVDESEVTARRADAESAMLLSFDGVYEDRSIADVVEDQVMSNQPEEAVLQRELRGTLRDAVEKLPGVHGSVIARYYLGGEQLQKIAGDLGVTEARVSQIRSEGIGALRSYLKTQYDRVPDVDERSPGKRLRESFAASMSSGSDWRTRFHVGGELAGERKVG